MGLIPSSPLGLKIALNDLGKGRPKKLEACEADFFVELKRAEWNSLHVMDADGRNLQRFVTSPEYVWQGSPAWSCDGTRLGFDAWRSIYGATYVDAHIFTCKADGKELKDIGVGAMPSWSPDGKRIAFSNYDPRRVWIMKADGTGRELIDSAGWGVRWCPKAEKIAYSMYGAYGSGANIVVRDLATNGVTTLLDDRYTTVFGAWPGRRTASGLLSRPSATGPRSWPWSTPRAMRRAFACSCPPPCPT
ncbi:MAG: TolB family protein [Thermoguttaceae bacterium]